MADSRLGWLVSVLIGCVLVAGVVLAFRMSRVNADEFAPQVVPEEAGKIYHERMHATETLLEDGFLEVSDSRGN